MKRLLNLFRRAERVASVAPYKPVGSEKAKVGQMAAPLDQVSPRLDQVSPVLPPITHPASVMTTSAKGLALIKSFESCAAPIGGGRFQAYPDPAPGNNGLPVTIGWGSTRGFDGKPIKLGTVWTQEQCDRKKAEDMADFERQVRAILGNAPTTQGQFDALVSFAYNLGSDDLRGSTLMRMHKAGNYAGAQKQFARWNRAGGQVLRGLTRRRAAEARMYGGEA